MTITELWASSSWRAEAEGWIRDALAAQSVHITGRIEQPRVRIWSAQLTVPTDAGLMWFKENNPGQRAEAAVVATLAVIAPDHVVPPIAVNTDRGWLLSPDRGATLASLHSTDVTMWQRVVAEYADLQRCTVEHGAALRAAGLQRLLPSDVPGHLEELARSLPLEAAASPLRIDQGAAARLVVAAATYRRIAAELDRGPLQPALEHNDLHHNNTFIPRPGEETLHFFDFGDALWGHPFVSLFVPLNVITHEWGTSIEDPRVQRVIDAYLEVWTDLADRAALREQLDLALNLGPVHRLECWRRLLVHVTHEEAAEFSATPRTWIGRVLDRAAAAE